jgi:hypothetical protein
MKRITLIAAIIFIAAVSAYSQNLRIKKDNNLVDDIASRLAFEVGISNSYPVQNLSKSNTPGKYQFAGSIYGMLTDKVSVYFNYSYIKFGYSGDYELSDLYNLPKNTLRTYNVGVNYSYEYKNHIPFVEGGIGFYSYNVYEPAPFPEMANVVGKIQPGINLGGGYRYLFDRRFGLFIKSKFHTFFYDSKNWSFWNISGGLYLKF